MNATPSVQVFWTMLGNMFVRLLGQRAHAQIIITVKDGTIQLVHVNQTFLPSDLPKA